MMFSQSPCLDCSGRYIGCHADCPTFRQWKTEEARKNAQIQKSLQAQRVFDEVRAEKRTRIQRKIHSAQGRGFRVK